MAFALPSQRETEPLVKTLRDPHGVQPAKHFPSDCALADQPGLYAWWTDDQGRAQLSQVLGTDLPPLIYAGQAGATAWPSGKRTNVTLLRRIRDDHLGGNIRFSTFRRTLAATLRDALDLRVIGPSRLDDDAACS